MNMVVCSCDSVTVGAALLTVTVTPAEVLMLPAASVTCAVSATEPPATVVVSHAMENGAEVASPI